MKKDISVIIPFKDKDAYQQLRFSIASLINQTILPFEIIVVGPEKKLKFLEDKKYRRFKKMIKLIYLMGDKNQARNKGIETARGRYILYLDHDMVADKKLVEDCSRKSEIFDVIIVPEKGAGGNFWENCKRLEKELIAYDIHTVTPRFFRRSIFKKNEKLFDKRFGLLDEWGFNHNLAVKKTSIGYSNSFVTVKEKNLTLIKEIINKFQRGLWMRYFYNVDKKEAWDRINPIKRGVFFYGSKLFYLFKEPIYFPGLIFLKSIDFVFFMIGYLASYFIGTNYNE